jgi:hypothetical protein
MRVATRMRIVLFLHCLILYLLSYIFKVWCLRYKEIDISCMSIGLRNDNYRINKYAHVS